MKEAVELLCNRKINENHENSVGLIAMKYDGPDIVLHLTEERRWNTAMSRIKLSHGKGFIQIDDAIRKARLALKHRRNTKQEKKIVVIVCSPVISEAKPLMRLAKDLKKNNLSLDIICFGVEKDHPSKTVEKLQDMVNACKTADNCNFFHLPDEKQLKLTDSLLSSPIVQGFGNVAVQPAAAPAGGEAQPAAGGDVDPNQDPELHYALRLSMEMMRQEAENRQQNEGEAHAAPEGGDAQMEDAEAPAEAAAEPAPAAAAANPEPEVEADAEDDELMAAIALSMQDEDPEDVDELQRALAMSMEEDTAPAEAPQQQAEDEDEDRQFLADLMAELPGVDADEIDVEEIMTALNADEDKKPEDKDKGK